MNTLTSVLRTFIAYEKLITGIEAGAVLRRLAARLETEFGIKSDVWQMDSGIWKFEMLRDPELWELAVTEAIEADMIIVAVGGTELPACVRNWIEKVLPMKDGRPGALVTLSDRARDASGGQPRPETYLRRLAGQYGLDFFCNTDAKSDILKPTLNQSSPDSTAIRRVRTTFPRNCSRQEQGVNGLNLRKSINQQILKNSH